ncbi:MAG: DUF3793 family protein [Treponema sp.]|nr:DUF3793 family protein [Treponema sp.]
MSFDQTIVHCSAPALCGIKPSCLFSMDRKLFDVGVDKIREWNKELTKEGSIIVPLFRSNVLVLLFVYNRDLLTRLCSSKEAKRYLTSKGYILTDDVQLLLAELFRRLAHNDAFPHEVGFFLGYPLEDVIAFEKTQGKGFRYSGLWKVYGDVEAARHKISKYNACRFTCSKLLDEGLSIPAVVHTYKISC